MRKTIIVALALSAGVATMAQDGVNAPTAQGYIDRARLMMDDANYNGCIDQGRHALSLPLSSRQESEAQLLIALATVHTEPERAAVMLRQWLADNAASSERYTALMALGDCYYGHDYSLALDYYSEIPATALSGGLRDDLCYKLAYCDIQVLEYDDAMAWLDKLEGSKDYALAAKFYRAYISYSKGDYPQALPLMQEVARYGQAPCDMAPYYIAQMQYARGYYAEALSAAKQLLGRRASLDGQYLAEATRIAGESAWHLDDEPTALTYLHQYLKLTDDPTPSALYMLGVEAYRSGAYDEAIRCFEPAAKIGDAMSQSAYLYIGQALMKLGDYSGAALSFDKALSMDYDAQVQETAFYNYAVASIKGGKVPFGNTVSTLQNFLHKFPNSRYAPQAQEFIIASYLNDGNYEAALQNINSMSRPTSATLDAKQKVLYLLGSELLTRDAARAITLLDEAVKMTNDPAVARESQLALGEAYLRDAKYADAAAWLSRYVKSAPKGADNLAIANYDLGYALLKQHKYAEATTALRQAVSSGALNATALGDAYARLGDCYFYQNKYQQAYEAYGQAYDSNREVGDYALYSKGMMQGYMRNHQARIDILTQLEREYPRSPEIPSALLGVTESYLQLGDNGNAVSVLRDLAKRFPNTEQARQGMLQLAITYINMGNKSQGLDTYREVVSTYPASAEAKIATDELKRMAADDGTLTQLMAFLNSVPGAQRLEVDEADDLSYEAGQRAVLMGAGTQMLSDYIAAYPSGTHRAQALATLVEELQDSQPDEAYTYAVMLAEQYPDTPQALGALSVKAQMEQDQGKGNLALRSWQELEAKASTAEMLNASRMGILRTATDIGDDAVAIEAGEALMGSAALASTLRDEATYLTAVAYSRSGDETRARQLWSGIAQRVGELYGIRSAFSLANSYYRAGDLANAEIWAQQVATASTPHIYWMARGFILLADIYADQGETYKAQQYLITLRDKYPGNEADIFTMIDQRLK